MKVNSLLSEGVEYDADSEGIVWVIWRQGHAYLGLEFNGGGGDRVSKRLVDRGFTIGDVAKADDNRLSVWHLHTFSVPLRDGEMITGEDATCGNIHADKSISFRSTWCRRTHTITEDGYQGQDAWRDNAARLLQDDRLPERCRLGAEQSVKDYLKIWNALDDHPSHFNDERGFARTGAVIEKWLVDVIIDNCDEVAYGTSTVGAKIQTENFQRWFGGFTTRSGWSEEEVRGTTNCITAVYDILNAHGITFCSTMNFLSYFSPGAAVSSGGLEGKILRTVQ